MNTLESLSKELEEVTAVATKNIDEVPAATRGSWGVVIEDARNKLVGLKAAYKQQLLKNGVAIFLSGDQQKAAEFATTLVAEEGLVANASALYERIGSAVAETLAGRENEGVEWGVAQTHRLHLALQEVMHEVGVRELPMPDRTATPFVVGRAAIVAHVRTLIRNASGDLLNALYMEDQIVRQAMLIRYTQGMTPVAILGATEEEYSGLARAFAKGSTVVELEATDNIDKEFLVKTFKDVTKQIKKTKKNESIETTNTKE